MILAIETVALCLLFWLLCFLGTGNDLKNINNFHVFSKPLQDKLLEDDSLKDKIKKEDHIMSFVYNTVLFLVLLFVLGIFVRSKNYIHNLVALLIMGEGLNLFDFLIIDLCWFRNNKHIRLSNYQDPSYYKEIKPHFMSFLRALPMYLIVALIDAALLTLF